MNVVAAAALFLLGGAIAALLPRPLQEDKRITTGFKKHKHANLKKGSGKTTQSGGVGGGGNSNNK
jgi:hypothetical protein